MNCGEAWHGSTCRSSQLEEHARSSVTGAARRAAHRRGAGRAAGQRQALAKRRLCG